jgi:hypothetical protein
VHTCVQTCACVRARVRACAHACYPSSRTHGILNRRGQEVYLKTGSVPFNDGKMCVYVCVSACVRACVRVCARANYSANPAVAGNLRIEPAQPAPAKIGT